MSIEETISKHVDLRKSGLNLIGLCPFHSEKTPSFTVSPKDQSYHCFGCGARGSVDDFEQMAGMGQKVIGNDKDQVA